MIATWWQARPTDAPDGPHSAPAETPGPDVAMRGNVTGTHPPQAGFPPVAAQPSGDNPSPAHVASFEPEAPLPDSPATATVVDIGEPMDADDPLLEAASPTLPGGKVINIGPPLDVDQPTPDSTSIPGTVISIGPAMNADGDAGGTGVMPADTSTETVSIGEAISADE